MAEKESADGTWLPVIGKTLAYLCLKVAEKEQGFEGVLDRVDFLEGLGLPPTDAATAAGSSKASVDELRRLARNKKAAGKNGKAKKARR